MPRSIARLAIVLGLLTVLPMSLAADPTRRHATAVERYGLEGFVQPIGLHHGFHITQVVPGSAAEQDRLGAHDVIVKVDGELIRSLEHMQTLFTDAYEDDGKVVLTLLKNGSLEHHVVKADLRGRDAGRTARGDKTDKDGEQKTR